MRPVRILDQATQETEDAASRYEAERPGLGSEFFEAVETAFDLIEEGILPLLPISGKIQMPGLKRILLKRFPYDVVVVERPDTAVVIAVAHHSRKPGYWHERLGET